MKPPLDTFPYSQGPDSQPADSQLADGLYAYVQDEFGVVWVARDRPHVHPKVLGGGRPAMYAGDMSIVASEVADLTNLSGTFQFDDPDGLLAAAAQLERQGLNIRLRAVRFFPADGTAPRVLR